MNTKLKIDCFNYLKSKTDCEDLKNKNNTS